MAQDFCCCCFFCCLSMNCCLDSVLENKGFLINFILFFEKDSAVRNSKGFC